MGGEDKAAKLLYERFKVEFMSDAAKDDLRAFGQSFEMVDADATRRRIAPEDLYISVAGDAGNIKRRKGREDGRQRD